MIVRKRAASLTIGDRIYCGTVVGMPMRIKGSDNYARTHVSIAIDNGTERFRQTFNRGTMIPVTLPDND